MAPPLAEPQPKIPPALTGAPPEIARRPAREALAWVSWRGLVPDPERATAREFLAIL